MVKFQDAVSQLKFMVFIQTKEGNMKRLTIQDYTKAVIILGYGSTIRETAEQTGLSYLTISRINKSRSFKNYRQIVKQDHVKLVPLATKKTFWQRIIGA